MKYSIIKCHDRKCKVKNGNKKFHGANIDAALDTAANVTGLEEHITIACRAKDKNGEWYSTVSVLPLAKLKPGDEIVFGIKKINKMVIK